MRIIEVVFGLGGFCENCDATHDHPLNNIVEITETPDEETTIES
jgi:hypothetical protein